MAATREYGAQVLTYDPVTEDRETICQRLALERGMLLVPPSENRHVIAGQGTAALELLEEVPWLDYLLSAWAAAVCWRAACWPPGRGPAVPRVWRGARGGQRRPAVAARRAHRAHCVAAQHHCRRRPRAGAPGPWCSTSPAEAEGIVTASDEQLVQAMRFFAQRMKIVVEPTGALRLAGAWHGGMDVRGSRVGIIISGGNVDLPRYARFLAD